MIWKYIIACLVLFGLLAFLKHVEGSPIRSWKGVFLVGIPVSLLVCFWLNWAYPSAPPPQSQTERAEINKAEMLRTLRRIEGVDRASIDGPFVMLNFSREKSLDELKQIARTSGSTAAHFLKVGETNRIFFHITVRGQRRYEMEYVTGQGIISEKTF